MTKFFFHDIITSFQDKSMIREKSRQIFSKLWWVEFINRREHPKKSTKTTDCV